MLIQPLSQKIHQHLLTLPILLFQGGHKLQLLLQYYSPSCLVGQEQQGTFWISIKLPPVNYNDNIAK